MDGGGKRATWLTAKILGRGGCCKIIRVVVRIFKICLKKEEKRRSHTKYKSEITHPTSRQYISPADWWFFLESRSDVSLSAVLLFVMSYLAERIATLSPTCPQTLRMTYFTKALSVSCILYGASWYSSFNKFLGILVLENDRAMQCNQRLRGSKQARKTSWYYVRLPE